MALHLIKLCVGCDTVEELLAWRESVSSADWRLPTRQTPTRAEALVNGGSLYRVFKGLVLCRQRILKVETAGDGAARCCQITLDPEVVRVTPTPRRPFQGWRYLDPKDAPADLQGRADWEEVPASLALRLRELGVW
jgi:hypothetical protein